MALYQAAQHDLDSHARALRALGWDVRLELRGQDGETPAEVVLRVVLPLVLIPVEAVG
jgi:hypothetical protein